MIGVPVEEISQSKRHSIRLIDQEIDSEEEKEGASKSCC